MENVNSTDMFFNRVLQIKSENRGYIENFLKGNDKKQRYEFLKNIYNERLDVIEVLKFKED